MNFNEALLKNALLNELGAVKSLGAKAMTEKILLSIHYRKAVEEWTKAREAIDCEENATDEVKAAAVESKANDDCGMEERRMSTEAFAQVVEAVLPNETIVSLLAPQKEDGMPGFVPSAVWLNVFAEQLVKI